MAQNRPANPKSVFVGNIPYDASEKELIDIFSEVGRVISFRLVEDRDSKKPKGYGFCEYADTETALSAIRNLNNRELNKRTLRVSYADNDKALMNELMQQQQQAVGGGSGGSSVPPIQPSPNVGVPNQSGGGGPPNMMGGGGPPNQGSWNINNQGPPQKDPIQAIIESANSTQLFETLSKFKHFSITQPDQARNILSSNPQLALALLHSQVVLGMMSPQTAQQIINKQPGGPSQGPSGQQPPFNQSPNIYHGGMGMNPNNMGGNMGGMNPPMGMNINMGGNMGGMNPPMGMNNPGNMGGMSSGMGGMNNPVNMGGMNNPSNNMGGMNNPGNMGGMNPNNMGGMSAQGNMPGGMYGGPPPPNQQGGGGNTPPPPGITSAAMNNWNILTETQKQFVHYVITLSPQQIESQIPMNSRNQVMQIRNLYSRS